MKKDTEHQTLGRGETDYMQREVGKVREVLFPRAEFDHVYLDDLTTAGTVRTGHTNVNDWYGLHAQGTHAQGVREPRDVPGLQIDGYFLDDDSTTTQALERLEPGYYYDPGNQYGNKKYLRDSQFVIRFPNPDLWNGKLVITSPPGVRGQYANDFIIGDFVLARGYAFAATDKGNSGPQFSRAEFYPAGKEPGSAVTEWHWRVKQLTETAKDATEIYYGKKPDYTYITGISNAGYITRYALENEHELYDGGVDWEGVLWLPTGPNLLTFLPPAIKNYQAYLNATSEEERQKARKAMIDAGFALDSEFLWRYHFMIYWNLTQRIFRREFDPDYSGSTEAEYNYADRPQAQAAVAKVSLSGNIGRRLITLHGTLDTLLPVAEDSDKYAVLVDDAGCSELHRYYRIEEGTHIDALFDHAGFRGKLRPILPCYRASFEALEKWVEKGIEPPQSQTVPKPPEGVDIVNTCPTLGYDGRPQRYPR